MKIKEIKTGRISDVSDSFGARMIEQGKAVVAPAAVKKSAPAKPATPAREKGKKDVAV